VTVELRYQLDPDPGEAGKRSFVFFKETRKVTVQ
jgi:hypothetical protein